MQPRERAILGQLADVDLRLLRVFRAVADCGGMAAAELELNIAMSTISRHIKDLEERFGMVLCRRGRSGFALTPEGERIYAASERLLRGLLDFSAKSDGSTDERWRGFWRLVTRKCLSDNGFLLVLQSGCSPHQCWVDFSRWCLFSPQFATAGSAPRSAPVGSGRRRAG